MDTNLEREKISVENFIEQFNKVIEKTDDKDEITEIVDSIIYRDYVPVLEKKLTLQEMLNKSIVEKDGIEYIDEFASKINVTTAILLLYTKLDLSASKVFDHYDLLMGSHALELIFLQIGETEMNEIMLIQKQIEKTFYNQQTVAAFIASQVTRFGELIGTMSSVGIDKLASFVEDEDKMNSTVIKIKSLLENVKNNDSE